MSAISRNNVHLHGDPEAQPMLFAHGFGCDQNMWRHVWPAFAERYRTVLFDHVGAGGSQLDAFDREHYASLHAYASDMLDICAELDLRDVVFVGHSVAAMIGVLAARQEPERFSSLILLGPSPRYIDDDGYVGGFSAADIEELLDSMDSNYLGWSSAMAPVIMGNAARPELGEELTSSFCATDPEIARQFARVTFTSDNRDDLEHCGTPSLVLQCSNDPIAPEVVGRYVAARLPQSEFVQMRATGHCPNLSAPRETIAAIEDFLGRGRPALP
ncbi:MAG: alpha/beta hydrolase [Solirubrobacteraceae bacterium]